ncbi:MaoC/PaaZ C-terminal domain-containing protein [Gordonia polyisoprenivorans]|uniref:MaoC/PaaZ C-terminal domain-containing protein n=1 Tax=Gordonia polyisoprenivorans TaxID=84595 RepID=UPI002300B892|nr:MaoC/PaaZ C-terminal domain-containing protein [Gordonia polyisoprenivorans]WCB35354.1 MaoC/PaaZ C-terminal domain-containing protein [Gordonia polyisoprenivorans]
MGDQHEFDRAGLDLWSDEEHFEVTRERLAEYAAATNDPIPAHLAGDIGSPVFAIVPVFDALMAPAVDVVPMNIFGRITHGEQDFHFYRPIHAGDKLVSRGRVIGWETKSTGALIYIHLTCHDEVSGDLVNEQYLSGFFRGVDAGEKVGDAIPVIPPFADAKAGTPTATVAAHVDDDQTFRYAPASGDPVPLHLDEEVAKDAGLPGIIAHGLCTMAMAGWAVVSEAAESDVTRVRRLAVRFSKFVFPGDDLETRIWRVDTANGVTTYAFETHRGTDIVLSNGLAEITD